MKVTVSVGGKFHAFRLAEQLQKRGHLHKLITTYYSQKRSFLPEFRTDAERIDPTKVVTNILPEALMRGLEVIPFLRGRTSGGYYKAEMFDYWAQNHIDRCDIVAGWSGFALHTLRRAKAFGAVTIVHRGSAHILAQKEILEEEYRKYGIRVSPIDERIVQKEITEYAEADYIFVPSEFAKSTFVQKGISPEKFIHIPYGVDLAHFKPIPKEDTIFRAIYVGALTLRKGVHYLLEAISQLRLNDFELLLIGPISDEIKFFLNKYKGFYRYIGKIPHLELYKYYSQGSIFVFPSIEEGLAQVLGQAMACGLPVVCTTNSGGSDIIRDGIDGFIIPIRNVEILKEKILYLYKHEEERKAMGQSALGRVRKFTWDVYGAKITQAYQEILHKG